MREIGSVYVGDDFEGLAQKYVALAISKVDE